MQRTTPKKMGLTSGRRGILISSAHNNRASTGSRILNKDREEMRKISEEILMKNPSKMDSQVIIISTPESSLEIAQELMIQVKLPERATSRAQVERLITNDFDDMVIQFDGSELAVIQLSFIYVMLKYFLVENKAKVLVFHGLPELAQKKIIDASIHRGISSRVLCL